MHYTNHMQYYNRSNIKYGNELRHNMTKEERHLWFNYLSSYRPRFYKQRLLGNYIVDFYCAKARLVIEIDGGQHYDEGVNQASDQMRTRYLNQRNIMVVRFGNLDIWHNFEGVCSRIDEAVRKRINPPDC